MQSRGWVSSRPCARHPSAYVLVFWIISIVPSIHDVLLVFVLRQAKWKLLKTYGSFAIANFFWVFERSENLLLVYCMADNWIVAENVTSQNFYSEIPLSTSLLAVPEYFLNRKLRMILSYILAGKFSRNVLPTLVFIRNNLKSRISPLGG